MRETHAGLQADGFQGRTDVPYAQRAEIANALLRHATETFVGQVVGAGGAGGAIVNVPFEPSIILMSEATGPTLSLLVRGGGLAADVAVDMVLGGVNATPAVVTQVGPGDWTVTLDTAEAPDGDTATVVILGFKQAGGSL